MSFDYHVLIVGAGAAGCVCAAGLPAGMRALLVDRADPHNGRCCGGLIAHDAKDALRAFAHRMPADVRVRPEPQLVHALDLESGINQTYRRCYWNVDRARFDSWLIDLATTRHELRPHTQFVSAWRTDSGFVALLRSSGTEYQVSCRYVVGADGATSAVRRTLLPRAPVVPRMIAIQVALPPAPRLDRQEVIFSKRLTDFYAWAVPKPDCVLVGAAFSDPRTAKGNFEELLGAFRKRCEIAGAVLARCSRLLSRPSERRQLCWGTDGILLVGEAAGLVSPSSGEGISYAVASGTAAAAALGDKNPERAYARSFAPIAGRVVRKFAKAQVIFTPWSRRIALRLPWYP